MRVTGAVHGGVRPGELEALGLNPADVLDFSVNVSPIGPPPGVHDAIMALEPTAYPDPDCTVLTNALSALLDVPGKQILIGNGSTQLIHLVTRVFVHQGQRPVVFAPTFGEFAHAVEILGANAYPWQAQQQRAFRWNLKNKPDVLRRVAPPLVYLCNPNNPTGVYLGRDEVRGLAQALMSGPLLLDEAYRGFLAEPWASLDMVRTGCVIVLRSMTKDYALAGLRLGYLVAHEDVVAAVRRLQPAWSVSSFAQAAGVAAVHDEEYLPRMRRIVTEGKSALVTGLESIGMTVHEGAVNFILCDVGDATDFRRRLLLRGIAVRDCSSFGLPQFIRIGVRTPVECKRLVEAMSGVLKELEGAQAETGIPG